MLKGTLYNVNCQKSDLLSKAMYVMCTYGCLCVLYMLYEPVCAMFVMGGMCAYMGYVHLVCLCVCLCVPACTGNQPPTVDCLQGKSYAALFLNTGPATQTSVHKHAPSGTNAIQTHTTDVLVGKQYAFSQWPYKFDGHPVMGYTVRTATGLRLTEYMPYSFQSFVYVF